MSFEYIENQVAWAAVGAIIGLFVTVIYEVGKQISTNIKYARLYSKYEGIYLAYDKYLKNDKPIRFFELTRKKNIFQIKNGMSLFGYADYEASITMDINTFNHGNGYYQHATDKDGITRFGFLEIQLANDNILVHETIFFKEGQQLSDGYCWIKQDYSRKNELQVKYREIQNIESLKKFGSS